MAGRIRIEPYKPLDIHTPPVPGGGYIQVDASAGTFGPSFLGSLGQEPHHALPGVLPAELARDDEAVVKDADVRLGEAEQALLFDPQTGYLNTQGQGAVDQAATVPNAYRQAQARESEGLFNDAQRQMLEGLAQRRLTTFTEQVEHHSATQRLRWHDTTSDRRITQMQADASFNWSDDALLRRALGTVRAEVRDKAERNGWDSPLTEAELHHQTSRTLASAIEAAVERDPDRAHSLRTRYDQHIEAADQAALDALLTEAQTRQRAQQASAEILNTTPPDGQTPALQWQLHHAEAITDAAVRAATLRTLHSAAASAEAHARALAEQILTRVLKEDLTAPSQIPVHEWVALGAEHRQSIETRLDHNAAGTEPAPNPELVDELATQMIEAPSTFARRDLLPSVAYLPLSQWQRFRDLQAGIRRNDATTEEELYAIKRGLQLANKMLPDDTPDDIATNYRAELVEEIDTWRRINGKSPDDATIVDMVKRHRSTELYVRRTLEGDQRYRPELVQIRDDTTTYMPSLDAFRRILELVIGAEASRQLNDAMRSMSKGVQGNTKEFAAAVGLKPADGYPSRIVTNGEDVYYNPQTGHYFVRNNRGKRGFWIEFDKRGELVGVVDMTMDYPTPRDRLSDEQVKEWTRPVPFPAADPQPPPPGLVPPPLPQWQEGFTVVPPPRPLPGISLPEIELPPYLETEEGHHKIPQFLWNPRPRPNPDWKPKYIFSPDAIKVFKGLTVYVPKGEHWGTLHAAYNREALRQLQAYLEEKANEHQTTPEGYAGSMNEDQARECAKAIEDAIQNPDYTKPRTKKEEDDAKLAKDFLDKITLHQEKKSGMQ
jgi:hypothetical protein